MVQSLFNHRYQLFTTFEFPNTIEIIRGCYEWKKQFLAEGAKDVNIWEGGYGEFVGAWLFAIEWASAADFGAAQDKFVANSKSFDDAMEVWQKTPVLKFRGGGLINHIASI